MLQIPSRKALIWWKSVADSEKAPAITRGRSYPKLHKGQASTGSVTNYNVVNG